MKKLAIIGAGGFGREIVSMFFGDSFSNGEYEFIGFIDDNAFGNTVEGYPIVGTLKDLFSLKEKPYVVIAVADPKTKELLVKKCINNGLKFATLIHSTVVIGTKCNIGEGSIICSNNIITTNVNIGSHCILNIGCSVGHDTTIGNYCSAMSYTAVAGESSIGESCYFGLHCTVINRVKIGSNSTFGAGSVVIKDLQEPGTYAGVPVRLLHK